MAAWDRPLEQVADLLRRMSTAGRLPIPALVVASALFGGAVTGTKYALGGFDPFTLLLVELFAATVALWACLLARGYRRPQSWKLAVVLGLLEPGSAYLGQTFGLAHTSAAHGAVICGLESAFVVLLAAAVLRERITRSTALAVLLAFIGLIVLQGGNPFGGAGFGDLFVALGVLSASAYTVVLKRSRDASDSLALTACQFTAATTLAFAVVSGRWAAGASTVPSAVPAKFWVAAALVGIGGFGLSFILFNASISRITAGAASVVLNLIPIFGLLSATLVLGETLGLAAGVGALLIGSSVLSFVVVEVRAVRSALRPRSVPQLPVPQLR